jgi:hypothetical protein
VLAMFECRFVEGDLYPDDTFIAYTVFANNISTSILAHVVIVRGI